MQKRRKYSQEYKQEAVQLVQQSNIPLAQVATNLGINPIIYGAGLMNSTKLVKMPSREMAHHEIKNWLDSSVSCSR